MPKTLRGGTFNLKYGRDPVRVLVEVTRLFNKHDLDFLAVQEFSDYRDEFADAKGWQAVPTNGPCESGIIVRAGVKVAKQSRHEFGDGWITARGGNFPPAVQHEVLLDGWLWVRSGHWPTPSEWRNGHPVAPPERLDDLQETATGDRIFFDHPAVVRARLLAADFNEPPETQGRYSPRWVAETTKATITAPRSRAGHGRIDYVIHKGCRVLDMTKDLTIPELSDHEPVVFRVVKGR